MGVGLTLLHTELPPHKTRRTLLSIVELGQEVKPKLARGCSALLLHWLLVKLLIIPISQLEVSHTASLPPSQQLLAVSLSLFLLDWKGDTADLLCAKAACHHTAPALSFSFIVFSLLLSDVFSQHRTSSPSPRPVVLSARPSQSAPLLCLLSCWNLVVTTSSSPSARLFHQRAKEIVLDARKSW